MTTTATNARLWRAHSICMEPAGQPTLSLSNGGCAYLILSGAFARALNTEQSSPIGWMTSKQCTPCILIVLSRYARCPLKWNRSEGNAHYINIFLINAVGWCVRPKLCMAGYYYHYSACLFDVALGFAEHVYCCHSSRNPCTEMCASVWFDLEIHI